MGLVEKAVSEENSLEELQNLVSVIEDQTRLAEPRYFDYSELINFLKKHYARKVYESPRTNPQIFLLEYKNLLESMNAGNDILLRETAPFLSDADAVTEYLSLLSEISVLDEQRDEAKKYIQKNLGIPNVRLYDNNFNQHEELLKKTEKKYNKLRKRIDAQMSEDVRLSVAALTLVKSQIEAALSDIPDELLLKK